MMRNTTISTTNNCNAVISFLRSNIAFLFLMTAILVTNSTNAQCQNYQVYESIGTGLPTSGGTWAATSMTYDAGNARTGSNSLVFNAANDAIRTPLIAAPGVFSFWYERNNNSTTHSFSIETSTNGTSGWTVRGTTTTPTTSYQQFSVNLGALGLTNVYVRILDTRPGTDTRVRYVDDISWTSATTSQNISIPLVSNCSQTINAGTTYVFSDAGTENDVYNPSTDYTITFTPSVSTSKVNLNFSAFNTENLYDGMVIYNGPTTASPIISSGLPVGSNATNCPAGSFYGTNSPGSITSTDASGAITIRFRSDGNTQNLGWLANVTSIVPLPSITSSVVSLAQFTACNLTASTSQSFTVSGVNLTANILITAPTGFEVSTNNINFFDNRSLTQSSGSVASTTIYARMKSLSSNPSGGNILISSTSATTRNVAITGVLISPTGVSAGSNTSICAGSSTLLNGSGTGFPTNQVLSNINDSSGFSSMTTNDVNRWGYASSTNAGGVADELRMQWSSGNNPTNVNIFIQSPLLDASTFTGLSMTFKHNLDWYAGTAPLAMQTSTDGTTWTTRWNLNATGNVAADTVTVDLSSVNGTSFYYRFLYNGNIYNIDYWYIDDIAISGTSTAVTYSWTSSPSGFTSLLKNPTVTPSVTTTYTLAVTSSGCTVTAPVTITVNDLPTIAAISTPPALCAGASINPATPTVTANGSTVTAQNWQIETAVGNNTFTNVIVPYAVALGDNGKKVRYTSTNGCGTTNGNQVTLSINAVPTSGILTPTPAAGAVCAGTSVSATATAGNGGAGSIADELQVSLSGSAYVAYTSGTAISTTGQTSVSIRTRRTATGTGCTTSGYNTVTWTINPGATASVLSGSAAICSGSPTSLQIAITGGTSPYTVVYSGGTINGFTNGTNITVAPTTTTAYTLTSVTDANGCVGTGNSGTATVSIDSTTSTDGGLTWSNGTPNATKSVLFDGATGTIGADFDACSLRLTNNATVTVSSGFDVTLNGRLTVDAGSTFTLNNNANLLQNSTLTNSGTIVVKRNTSALKRLDYTLWASPVSGQGIYAFTPLTFANRFYAYRTNTNVFNNADVGLNVTGLDANSVNGTDANNVPFAQAKGYLIRMPWNHPTTGTVWNGSFTGVPNNGNINYTMTNGGLGNRFNLVGNPYPSPIDAVAFVSNSNNNTTTTGTLYFWRKTNNALSPSYCIWTLGGFVSNGEAQVFDPNDVIQTGQGFFVEGSGNGSGTVNFDNTMRIDDHANQFFRTTATNTTTTTLERNRIWLNATNATGLFSQAMVGYITNATQGIDAAIDGKYINDGDIALTSLINDVPYAIQGRALPFDSSDIVPMSFKATTAGNYTIAIDHVDGIFTGGAQSIYLKDNLTTTIHDLNAGAYTFTSDAGTFNNRFEVVYQTQLSNPVFTVNAVVIYSQNNEFVVNSGNFTMSSIKVFDVRGRLIEEKKGINATETTIKGGLANQMLLVQITTEDGIVVTKKVIR